MPDLHFVNGDDRGCFGGRLSTKNDDTMTSSRQAHCVLSQYTLRAADHWPWGDIGEQENFHTNQCNGRLAEIREFDIRDHQPFSCRRTP